MNVVSHQYDSGLQPQVFFAIVFVTHGPDTDDTDNGEIANA